MRMQTVAPPEVRGASQNVRQGKCSQCDYPLWRLRRYGLLGAVPV